MKTRFINTLLFAILILLFTSCRVVFYILAEIGLKTEKEILFIYKEQLNFVFHISPH